MFSASPRSSAAASDRSAAIAFHNGSLPAGFPCYSSAPLPLPVLFICLDFNRIQSFVNDNKKKFSLTFFISFSLLFPFLAVELGIIFKYGCDPASEQTRRHDQL